MTQQIELLDDVPFSLMCASCSADGPGSYDEALTEGWQRIAYTPDPRIATSSACAPIAPAVDGKARRSSANVRTSIVTDVNRAAGPVGPAML